MRINRVIYVGVCSEHRKKLLRDPVEGFHGCGLHRNLFFFREKYSNRILTDKFGFLQLCTSFTHQAPVIRVITQWCRQVSVVDFFFSHLTAYYRFRHPS